MLANTKLTSDRRSPTSDVRPPSLGFGLLLFLLLLQFWSRYMPSPMTVFVADDWMNWARSSFYDSHLDAFLTGLQDPNRPLSMAAVEVVFRVFGRNQALWTVLSVVANSLLLLFVVRASWSLTRRRDAAFLAGAVFALLPNLTETYHWSTQVLNEVFCAIVFYGLSLWMWVEHVRRGGAWRLLLSACAYLIGLFSYEAGILLPGSYLFLLTFKGADRRRILSLLPFAAVFVLYAVWRVTDSFGLNASWHYPPHMEAGISAGGVIWNLKEFVLWWSGDHFFGALLNGFRGFATLDAWPARLLFAANALVVSIMAVLLFRFRSSGPIGEKAFRSGRIILFALAWVAAGMAICAVSYTAPRLNVIPAIGVSLLFGHLLSRVPARIVVALLALPAMLCLVSNQGTAESYRQVGELNRGLYEHIVETEDQWRDKDVLLVDTKSLRQRLTRGLLEGVSRDQSTWAQYHNALMIRGFVPRGMVMAATGKRDAGVLVLHDIENGTRVADGLLHWHERYAPAAVHQTPMERVFPVDPAEIVWAR